VFGIDSTGLVDAPPPPPPIDAPPPFTCPPPGTLPTFGNDLTMVPAARDCYGLVVDATGSNLAAMCLDSTSMVREVHAGSAESFGKIAMNVAPLNPSAVRIAPEGDHLFVHDQELDATMSVYDYFLLEYTLQDGMWMKGNKLRPPGTVQGDPFTIGQPTRGPTRRMAWIRYNDVTFKYDLVEFAWDGTTTTELYVTDLGDIGMYYIDHVSLTGDGLRALLTAPNYGYGGGPQPLDQWPTIDTGDAPVYYMDRASIDVPFAGTPKLVESIPNRVTGPVMTEDCGRVYFGALDRYWYLEQPR